MRLVSGLAILLLFSCKSVRPGHVDSTPNGKSEIAPTDQPGIDDAPEVEDKPVVVTKPAEQELPPPSREAPPLPAPTIPIKEPEKLERFVLRSLDYSGAAAKALQYRVNLSDGSLAIDEYQINRWSEKSVGRLNQEQIAKFRAVLAASPMETYAKCRNCASDIHLIVLESMTDGKVAKSFAMSDECVCGGVEDRKPNLPYAGLNELVSSFPQ